MAKQKHGQSDYSSSRSRRPQLAYPSSSVLSILATIAASSQAVDGSPLPTPPPSFLCPFIEHQIRALPPTATTSSSTVVTPSLSAAIPISSNDNDNDDFQLADKYVQGSDGRWRKTGDWTLFGSAVRSCLSFSKSSLNMFIYSVARRLLTLTSKHPKLHPLPQYKQGYLTMSFPLVGARQIKPSAEQTPSSSCH
jgi:hypothetical protein